MAKPIILFVIADSTKTGAPRQVAYLAQALLSRYNVQVACPKGWLLEEMKKADIPTHQINDRLNLSAITMQLRKIYAATNPDVIHCHGVRGGLVGRLSANPTHAKMVYTEHLWTNDFHLPNRIRESMQLTMLRFLSRKTDRTIAVSEAVKKFIVDRKIAPEKSVTVIYGAIKPMPEAKPIAEPIIGTLGKLTWVKGTDVLLKALPSLIEQFPTLKCRIGGDGPARKWLEKLASNLHVTDHIDWVGEVRDPAKFYSSLQVYVQPSRSESFGMAVLEAMSEGIPVVASRVGALPEIIDDGICGLLFPMPNHLELSHQLAFLLSSEDVRTHMRERCRPSTHKYSLEKMAEAHDTLYQELITHDARKT